MPLISGVSSGISSGRGTIRALVIPEERTSVPEGRVGVAGVAGGVLRTWTGAAFTEVPFLVVWADGLETSASFDAVDGLDAFTGFVLFAACLVCVCFGAEGFFRGPEAAGFSDLTGFDAAFFGAVILVFFAEVLADLDLGIGRSTANPQSGSLKREGRT